MGASSWYQYRTIARLPSICGIAISIRNRIIISVKLSGISLPDLQIRIIYFGSRRIPERIDRRFPLSPTWALHWNRTRTGTATFGAQTWALNPEHVALILPRTSAHETLAEGEEHSYVHFSLGPRYYRTGGRLLVLPIALPIQELLGEVSDSFREKSVLDHRDEFSLHALLFLVLRGVPDHLWPEQPADSRIRRVLDILDERPGEKLANPTLARAAGLATSSFLRLFREQVGMSPQRYLLDRRLGESALLLAHSDESVEHVASRCGFCDRNYFSAMFGRHYGLGPAAYRKLSTSNTRKQCG